MLSHAADRIVGNALKTGNKLTYFNKTIFLWVCFRYVFFWAWPSCLYVIFLSLCCRWVSLCRGFHHPRRSIISVCLVMFVHTFRCYIILWLYFRWVSLCRGLHHPRHSLLCVCLVMFVHAFCCYIPMVIVLDEFRCAVAFTILAILFSVSAGCCLLFSYTLCSVLEIIAGQLTSFRGATFDVRNRRQNRSQRWQNEIFTMIIK